MQPWQSLCECTPFGKTLHDVTSDFQIDPISSDEVMKLVDKIKTHKSSAIDGLMSQILKDAFGALSEHLSWGFFPRAGI